ncbi:ATP-dependent helicase, partial [Actinotalea sp.]|uniref:ATP-dependent helicase n=1 Tax=Actinotalea sp. TaxID=1872145 RepID=UPI0035661BFC
DVSRAAQLSGLARGAGGRRMRSAAEIAELVGTHPPTPEQRAVIEAPLEPALVVAGAGSGKTETMAARVVYLVANGLVEPDRVLGLTFTRKAAGELSDRVRARLRALRRATGGRGTGFHAPTVATYNSYAASLVADHAVRIGVEPSARLLGEAGRWQIAHDVVEHWAGDLDTEYKVPTITTAVLDLAGELAEHLVDPQDLRRELERTIDVLAEAPAVRTLRAPAKKLLAEAAGSMRLRSRLVALVEEFTARKRAQDVMDFADQVALAARVAREVPEVGAGERLRYGVVLLDEYQDTSVAQLVLLRHLFGADSGAPGHPVTAVGDPHQSIYGWRGASAGGLEQFPVDFPRRAGDVAVRAPVLALSTSWRNDHAVLAVANATAEPLRAAVDARRDADTPALPVLRARPAAGPGVVEARFLETQEEEAAAVARFIVEQRALLSAERPGSVTSAVLCRTRAQFVVLEQALLAAGLEVEVAGLGGLLDTPEVADVIAALEAAHDPSRGDSLMRLLTGPRAHLGLADLAALSDWARELPGEDHPRADRGELPSIVDALDQLPPPTWVSRHGRQLGPEGRARLGDLGGILRSLRSQTFLPVADLVAEAERLLGLDIEVAVGRSSPATARAHLDAFRAVAAGFDRQDAGTLGAFLAWLVAARSEERGLAVPPAETDPDAVQIMTVHAAKGLEWDVVAVPGLVEKTFPTGSDARGWVRSNGAIPVALRGDRAHLPEVSLTPGAEQAELVERLQAYGQQVQEHELAEERRLAYVAVTRACSRLLLTGSWWRAGSTSRVPSRFLLELVDAGLIELDPGSAPAGPAPGTTPAADLTWPPAHPLGAERSARLDRAARAVRQAVPSASWTAGDDEGIALARSAELLLAERLRGREDQQVVALPAHLAASALVRLAADPAGYALEVRRPVPQAPSTVARRGTAFHAWVEQYFGSAALVGLDELPGADDDSVAQDADLMALRESFLATPWAGRTPIAVEVDIETPVGGLTLRSRIDAVFAEPDGGVVVVDWKTGRPPTDAAAQRARELQLAVYRVAWSRRSGLPLEKVDAAFVYVATGETERPTVLPGLEEIERALQDGTGVGAVLER